MSFPYLLLLLSGGHCQCVAVEGVGRYRRLGTTLDDAVGEAFDKSAKLLGLPWPGGPALERLARQGDPTRIPLPRPLLGRAGCDFSWSGLKTAVAHALARSAGTEQDRADIAAAFQASVAVVLADRAGLALDMLPVATGGGGGGGGQSRRAYGLSTAGARRGCRWWAADPALHGQRGHGRRAGTSGWARPGGRTRPCAAAALAAGGDGGLTAAAYSRSIWLKAAQSGQIRHNAAESGSALFPTSPRIS